MPERTAVREAIFQTSRDSPLKRHAGLHVAEVGVVARTGVAEVAASEEVAVAAFNGEVVGGFPFHREVQLVSGEITLKTAVDPVFEAEK